MSKAEFLEYKTKREAYFHSTYPEGTVIELIVPWLGRAKGLTGVVFDEDITDHTSQNTHTVQKVALATGQITQMSDDLDESCIVVGKIDDVDDYLENLTVRSAGKKRNA